MQSTPRHPLREYLRTPVGRALLLALAIAVVFGAFYITVLLAIPAILIIGIWLPIYVGLKRPRYLAVSGLAILLIVAPLFSVAFTNELLQPTPASHSHAAGVDWSVSVGNTTVVSSSDRVTFDLPTGATNYNITPIAGYTVGARSGTVDVGSASTSVSVAFTAVRYPVTFTETGLPSGTSWTVQAGGSSLSSTTATLVFELGNGSYPYRVGAVAGETPVTSSGTVSVDGTAAAVSVPFSAVAYPVSFTETGLPSGEPWHLSALGATVGSRATTIVLELPDGTTSYSATAGSDYASPGGQTVVVAGASTSATVPFVGVTFPVTFTESQLPSGTPWSMTVAGTVMHSSTSTIVFDLVNGTYPYVVGAPSGYSPVSGNSSLTVAGAPTGAPILFGATTHVVTFTESGLVAGPSWNLTIDGTTVNTTGTSVALNLSAGTYAYSLGPVAGYLAPAPGSVTVGSSAVSKTVVYTPVKYPVVFTESHLTSGTAWNVTINGESKSSIGAHVEFNLTNGTYSYGIGSVSGKTPPASNATVTIDGAGVAIAVPFATTTFSVTFTETGLASGAATQVIQDADVTPFHGSSSTEFTWTATIYPQYLPSNESDPLWVSLYISTCPGATSPNGTTYCSAGYAFYQVTDFFCSDPATLATCEASAPVMHGATAVSFNYTIGSDGIWDWQMGLAAEDLATHTPIYTLLVGDPTYDGIEGPIVGSYGTIFEVVLPSVYLEDFLYLGAPFYAVLLLYMFFKSRERRRDDARRRTAGPIPPTSGAETGDTPPSGGPAAGGAEPSARPPPGPGKGEQACPNCQAVVYPGEAKCWKCGATLPAAPSTPLPSK